MINYDELNLTKYQTPCYLIDSDRFGINLGKIRDAFEARWPGKVLLGYSVKTNNSRELLRLARSKGMLAEVVSGDEYSQAQECGYLDQNIIFNGPQKTAEQLINALRFEGIVNIDGLREIDIIESELEVIDPKSLKLGLRVNFDLESICPGETTAEDEVSRFGLCIENGDFETAVSRLHAMGIKISGLHMHYSSKTRSLAIFRALASQAVLLANQYDLIDEISFIDMGGGFFMGKADVPNKPTMSQYADTIASTLSKAFDPQKVSLILEPGASLVATCVDYVTRVVDVKSVRDVLVATMDGSVMDINPFMAHREPPHQWKRKQSPARTSIANQLVVGGTCMEKDRFFTSSYEEQLIPGDTLICECSGAYTMSFSNTFINNPPRTYVI